jgi:ABC-type branched-subunit amino acid transport system ATPase component
MLGRGQALLLEPEVLLIDELSLGLAPVIVQQLLEVVERLKDDGVTIVIVEQSVNVALSIADRAVFMEKGRIRFEGPARELMERDDLVRAVFLGGEVG